VDKDLSFDLKVNIETHFHLLFFSSKTDFVPIAAKNMPKTKPKSKPIRKKTVFKKVSRPWLIRDIKPSDLPEVYKLLSEKFPKEAIVEGKLWYGLETEGPRGQSVINRLNEVLGMNHWHYEYNVEDEKRGNMWAAVCGMKLEIGNWKTVRTKASTPETVHKIDVDTDKTVFIPLASRSWIGGVMHISRSEAKKGAITNALKKCAAAFGVGKEIYERLSEPEFEEQKEGIVEVEPKADDNKILWPEAPVNEQPLEVKEKGDLYADLLTELNSVQDKETLIKAQEMMDKVKNDLTPEQLAEAVRIFADLKKKYS